MKHQIVFWSVALSILSACLSDSESDRAVSGHIGHIERLSPLLDDLIAEDARIEVLATGYGWAEGPVWIANENMLLFSDVPANTIYRWRQGMGVDTYLSPSGSTGIVTGGSGEGSNGLLLDSDGRLILCQHGDRRVAAMTASLTSPAADFRTLADQYDDKRFNSPNDAVFDADGALYFTDPSYGLQNREHSQHRQLPYHGVYRLDADGKTVTLLSDRMSWPNGIAFSPDYRVLYVTNSDPEHAVLMAYDIGDDGELRNAREFFNVTDRVRKGLPGLPDGLKVDNAGNLYVTGPGGVLVYTTAGEHIGTINTTKPTANVAFNADKSALYITAQDSLLRLKINAH